MLLSIIVPVYNVELYIEKCIKSIIDIEVENFEIILVLGKSIDKSNLICYEYYNKYDSIKIIEQNSIGLSNARNCGMKVAKGKYITFMDSDDYIIPELFNMTIRKMLELEKKYRIDILVSDFNLYNIEGRLLYTQKQIKGSHDIIFNYEYTEKFISKPGAVWNVWRYIYSKEYLVMNNFYFLENHFCEDVDFTSRILLNALNIYFFHNPYYCYCGNRPDSLFNQASIKNIESLLYVVNNLVDDIEKSSIPFKHTLKAKLIKELILYLPSIYSLDLLNQLKAINIYNTNLYLLNDTSNKVGYIIYRLIKCFGVKIVAKTLYVLKIIRRKIVYKEIKFFKLQN